MSSVFRIDQTHWAFTFYSLYNIICFSSSPHFTICGSAIEIVDSSSYFCHIICCQQDTWRDRTDEAQGTPASACNCDDERDIYSEW